MNKNRPPPKKIYYLSTMSKVLLKNQLFSKSEYQIGTEILAIKTIDTLCLNVLLAEIIDFG